MPSGSKCKGHNARLLPPAAFMAADPCRGCKYGDLVEKAIKDALSQNEPQEPGNETGGAKQGFRLFALPGL